MANQKQGSESRIQDDLRLILGGRFSPDSVGQETFDEIVERVREQAAAYLDAFDRLLDDPQISGPVLAEVRAPALLHLLRDVAPERVRESARRWLDRAPATPAAQVSLEEAPAEASEDEVRRQVRIEQRRQALERLLAEEP